MFIVYKGSKCCVSKEMKLKNHSKDLIINEILALRRIGHSNLVNYVDAFAKSHEEYPDQLYILLIANYVEGCSLAELLSAGPRFDENEIAHIAAEVNHFMR